MFFVIILKFDHKVLKVVQKNCKVAAGCGSYHKLSDL